MGLDECRLIELPKIGNPRGNLTFIEGSRHIPFEIKRLYYLYDVPGGATRAGHGHKTLRQLMVALSGSFDVELDDGRSRKQYHLNRSYYGLYIPQMIWREIENFSSGSVCLVLASDHFEESDYYRDYEEFSRVAGCDVGANCVIGANATVGERVAIAADQMIAAGALVLATSEYEEQSQWAGSLSGKSVG